MSDTFKLNRRALMLGASVTAAALAASCAKAPEAAAEETVDLTGVSIPSWKRSPSPTNSTSQF